MGLTSLRAIRIEEYRISVNDLFKMKLRNQVAKETEYRPSVPMTMTQYNLLKQLYRGDCFYAINKRMLVSEKEIVKELGEELKNNSSVLNPKLYMNLATDFIGKTKAYSLFRKITGANVTDSEMIAFINKKELFEQECGYRNHVFTFTGKITRNNVEGQEFIALTFVSKVGWKCLKTISIFVDGCYSFDKGKIFLAVFIDANHMVQPIVNQICSVDSIYNGTPFMKPLYEASVRDEILVINSS